MSRSEPDKPFKHVTRSELFNGKVFCTMPWSHLHVTPFGAATPCCIAESCSTRGGMGDATKLSLNELVNTEAMRKLRLDMLNGVKNDECKKCHEHEEQNVQSFRQSGLARYPNAYNDAINTNSDGSVDEFNMRYYDMRFSNICNFKCRTCGQEFSSQWEQENLRSNVSWAYPLPKNKNKQLLNDVLEKIDGMEHAYFAGGEPLMMEEHYVILEEMIRRGKTDVQLSYNSNISNLQYKNKDLVELWSHFKKPIQLSASVDHVKERAEYIRNGTDWGLVESNFKKLRALPYVQMTMNSVLSVFNYLTFYDFYSYLIENDMYAVNTYYSVYSMSSPEHLTCHILPKELKEKGEASMNKTIELLENIGQTPNAIDVVRSAANWAKTKTTTYDYLPGTTDLTIQLGQAPTNLSLFKEEIVRLDKLRGESFEKVFPELTPILDL